MIKTKRFFVAALVISCLALPRAYAAEEESSAPKLMLDKSPAIIAFQLKRFSNPQLIAIERKADEPKYIPVYQAILTRKGIDKKNREDSVDALVKLKKSDAVTVLLEAVAKVDSEDKNTPRELGGLLLAQKPDAIGAQREKIETLARESESPAVKQLAYAALVAADAKPDKAWELAAANDGLKPLLSAISLLPIPAREPFYAKVSPLIATGEEATQAAAIEALGYIPAHEADAFKSLAQIIATGQGDRRAAAVRAVGRIPASKWPAGQVEPLARSIVKLVEKTPAEQRTAPEIIQAVQLGNDLAGATAPEKGAPIRKSLRALAVRVVLIHTLVEQMQYDLRYFTVQAGKPVQIVLENEDNMPHNLIITATGKFQEVAIQAGAMAAPEDPKEKPYVPAGPNVLQSTNLVGPGESITLSFDAPAKPGNYPFLCTYPGHWVKMYGIMQVVEDLDKYDASPIVPKDPMTHKPFDGQKNEASEAAKQPAAAGHEHH